MFLLKKSSLQDLKLISECHQLCFANSFSIKLGEAYTRKSLEWFLAGENRFIFHIIHENEVVGYCGGFISRFVGDGSTSGMLQYAMKQAIVGVLRKPWLLFHNELWPFYPIICKNIFRKIFVRKKSKSLLKSEILFADEFIKRAGIVVIGVHPFHRGKGLFDKLIKEFEKQAFLKETYSFYLSVKKNNKRAIRAYEKAGWQISKEHSSSLDMVKKGNK